jgi:hypothetical protein
MIFWTRGRRLTLAMILVLMVAVTTVAGFASPDHADRVLVVDLRVKPTDQELASLRGTADVPVIAIVQCVEYLCLPASTPADIRARATRVLAPSNARPVKIVDIAQKIYGPEISLTSSEAPNKYLYEAVRKTPAGFSETAAIIIAVLLVPLCGLLIASLLAGGARTRPNRVVAATAPPVQQHRQPPQPRTARVPMQPTAQPGQPRTTSALQPLVTNANDHAVARSHVTGEGGYVALGEAVVWAVLRPSGVAAPGDTLTVLRVDERNETLVVATPERRSRP